MSERTSYPVSKFFEKRRVGEKGDQFIKVAIKPMDQERAREAYPYRPFKEGTESRWGEADPASSDEELLSAGMAAPCKMCRAATLKNHLEEGRCPDCDGRAEYDGNDPHAPIKK